MTIKVLVIDPDRRRSQAASKLLGDAAYQVYHSGTGEEGLKKARDLLPDLVLVNISLPDSNGYLICELIKQHPALRDSLVMLVAEGDLNSRERAKGFELGADGVLTRPLSDRELIARVAAVERLTHTENQLRQTKRELEELNQQLVQSNQDLQDFAYAVSHDLQEPLRMITSFLDLLARRYEDDLDDTAHEYIEFAVDGAQRMKAMIQGVLAFSRVESRGREMQPMSSGMALQEALANLGLLIEETKALVHAEELPTEEAPEVLGDFQQISLVFQNLVDNAVRYNHSSPPEVWVSVKQEADRWAFTVRDNGPGIEPRNQERIFKLFQRGQARGDIPGVGMGLSIARRIVERHGGTLTVTSAPGGGSEFVFSLAAVRESTGKMHAA